MKNKGMKMMIFLLGGHDLEMLEIRNLLEKEGLVYFDHNLHWGNANFEQYKDILDIYQNKKDICIYGIELQEKETDIIPNNYTRIDHHNDFFHKKSSLEQVADLLNIKLDCYLQLVAINDSEYIGGLIKAGASQEKIQLVRRRDREAQGVTTEDELLAEEAIKGKELQGDVVIIQSKSSRFSPICDHLYPYDKLLIYTDEELIFYGEGKNRLVHHFANDLEQKKMFHGGKENGFIGLVRGKYSKKEIEEIKKEIITLVSNNK